MTELENAPQRRRLLVNAAVGGLTAAVLTAAHLHVVRRPAISGPILILDHLFNVVLTIALLAMCAAIGRRMTRSMDVYDSAVDDLAFSTVLGAGVLGTLILLLGALGGFHPFALCALISAAVLPCWRELRRMPNLGRRAANEVRATAGPIPLAILAVVAAAMIVLALAPPSDWDSLMYHLQIPAQFLSQGGVHVPADNLHVSFIGVFHMLYLPMLAFGAPAACALLNVMLGLLLAVAMMTAGARLFSPTAGRLALILLWGSPVMILGGVTSRVDVVLACYLFLGHYALLRAWNAPDHALSWAAIGGATLGFAFDVKYLALAYIAALAPVLALIVYQQRDNRGRLKVLTAFSGLAILAALPWLLKNWIMLGAPLYPQFATEMLPPWLASLYGSPEIPGVIEPSSLHPLSAIREPFSIRDWFFAPGRMTPEAEGSAYSANRIFPALLFSVLLLRNRAFIAVIAPALLFILAVLVHNTSLNLRYLTPALPALTFAAAVILAATMARTSSRLLRSGLLLVVVVFSMAPPARAVADKMRSTGAAAHAAGLISRAEYLQNPRNSETAGYVSMVTRVNELSAPDDRILLLFEARGFRFEAQTLQDNGLINWPLMAPAVAPPRCVPESTASHVLVATGVLGYFRLRGLDPETIGWEGFGGFASRCLDPVEFGRGWALFRTRTP